MSVGKEAPLRIAQLRELLGFGPKRLKILNALKQECEEVDRIPNWTGQVTFHVSENGSVLVDPHRRPRAASEGGSL